MGHVDYGLNCHPYYPLITCFCDKKDPVLDIDIFFRLHCMVSCIVLIGSSLSFQILSFLVAVVDISPSMLTYLCYFCFTRYLWFVLMLLMFGFCG